MKKAFEAIKSQAAQIVQLCTGAEYLDNEASSAQKKLKDNILLTGIKMDKAKEEMICDNCGMSFLKLSSTEWYKTNGCYCSSECRYEAETGHPGEQY